MVMSRILLFFTVIFNGNPANLSFLRIYLQITIFILKSLHTMP